MTPELLVLGLNAVVVLVAYFSIYPKVAGSDFTKIAFYDFFCSGFALLVVGLSYWGSGIEFDLLLIKVNWFWFTLATYALIEIPICLWYIKKHKVKL